MKKLILCLIICIMLVPAVEARGKCRKPVDNFEADTVIMNDDDFALYAGAEVNILPPSWEKFRLTEVNVGYHANTLDVADFGQHEGRVTFHFDLFQERAL